MSKSKITAIHVSNYLTDMAIDQGKPLTIMEALRWTYLAQGYHLSLEEEPFFEEEVFAWKYGPVIEKLYDHLKENNPEHIIKNKTDDDQVFCFEGRQKDILDMVYKKYKRMGAWALTHLIHIADSPWEQCYQEGKRCVIPQDIIREHFKEVVTPHSFAILLSER